LDKLILAFICFRSLFEFLSYLQSTLIIRCFRNLNLEKSNKFEALSIFFTEGTDTNVNCAN